MMFPFYLNTYPGVHVTSNGIFEFVYHWADYSNTPGELINDHVGGSAAWTDWLCYPHLGDNIFTHSPTANSYAVRWQLSHISDRNNSKGYFEVVLFGGDDILAGRQFQSGDILFNYGSRVECPSGRSPMTVGISAGNGQDYLFTDYSDTPQAYDLSNHDSILFTPYRQQDPLPILEGNHVQLNAQNGAVIDNNGDALDLKAVTTQTLDITAADGIGTKQDPIETQTPRLITYNQTGHTVIDNTGDLHIQSSVDLNGDIYITNHSNVTVESMSASQGEVRIGRYQTSQLMEMDKHNQILMH